jgi:hypothetical protein
MKDLASRLREKGWTQEEIEHAVTILGESKKHKPKITVVFDQLVYWVALILAIVGNIVLSVVLIPFLLVLNNIQLYIFVVVLAGSFGLLFSQILRDIEGLDKKHHVIAGIFIPALALINIYVMVNLANFLDKVFKLSKVEHNPVLISIVYVVFFTFPYIFRFIARHY